MIIRAFDLPVVAYSPFQPIMLNKDPAPNCSILHEGLQLTTITYTKHY